MDDTKETSTQGQPKLEAPTPETLLSEIHTGLESWSKDPKPEGVEGLKEKIAGYQTAAQKAAEAAKANQPIIPETYKLELPKDSLFDPAYLADLGKEGKEEKLTQTQVEARIARDHKIVERIMAHQAVLLKQQDETWGKELQADKAFGGDNFKANSAKAQKMFETLIVNLETREQLLKTGLLGFPGWQKELALAHDRLGLGEDAGGGGGPKGGQEKTVAERAFPNESKKS